MRLSVLTSRRLPVLANPVTLMFNTRNFDSNLRVCGLLTRLTRN